MRKILAIVPLLLLFSCGGGRNPKGQLQVSEAQTVHVFLLEESDETLADTVSLGTVRTGEVVRQQVMLQNRTGSGLVILSAVSSCGCTTSDYPHAPIPAEGEAKLTFDFDSRGMQGYQIKHIAIKTSNPKVTGQLVITAEVR